MAWLQRGKKKRQGRRGRRRSMKRKNRENLDAFRSGTVAEMPRRSRSKWRTLDDPDPNGEGAKVLLLKSVGVIEANVDTIFEVVLCLDRHKRYEWDMLTGDLELVDSVDGHYDVVYGTYEPTHLNWHFAVVQCKGFPGLKEYFGANPALTLYSPSTIVDSPISDASNAHTEFKDSEVDEEFFDAIASSDSLEDEDSDDDIELPKVIVGGDPLLKLIGVDWFRADNGIDKVALHPKSFIQIPSKPNYSLVLYYAAEKPINKESLLGRFLDGTNMFQDSRFKLIPRIVEGYWMVKRAVGSKACLLGKAVTCKYLRQDNFLEIDVDIGSSSVARSIISLVLGYITSIVVDLAILIEAKEEEELPEYILGTVRLNRVTLESAVPFWDEL
ncbi:hypothetical protein MUK42_32683 [Musa troglodytarum]|uniref:Protein ENHANCED DISEASE RESISTANCE 2 C-terminal domain-containing protein n=1 Tax=Musa troglodytarum TaxID=320322 RepID=A0A9E7KRI6_9LILI|nr:hypothetical protein MUK42_32683 [Musa troglodytarum]